MTTISPAFRPQSVRVDLVHNKYTQMCHFFNGYRKWIKMDRRQLSGFAKRKLKKDKDARRLATILNVPGIERFF